MIKETLVLAALAISSPAVVNGDTMRGVSTTFNMVWENMRRESA